MARKVRDKILVELTVARVEKRSDGENEYFIATSEYETDKGMWIDDTELSYIIKGVSSREAQCNRDNKSY